MTNLIDRRAALDAGLARYNTGQPCKHGHMADRFTANAGCVLCVNPKRAHPGSGFKWIVTRVPMPEAITLEPAQAAELESLLRVWAEYKLREWGFGSNPNAPVKANWGSDAPGAIVIDEAKVWQVRQADGTLKPTTRETYVADVAAATGTPIEG
jgi:hypothetical protein